MTALSVTDGLGVAEWDVWTTTARLVLTEPGALEASAGLVSAYLEDVGRAASRFRPDSEVSLLAASREGEHSVSPVLGALVTAALAAASETGGAVDPTLGSVLTHLGYGPGGLDAAPPPTTRMPVHARRSVTWRDVALQGSTLRMPPGTLLDLGATAKAYAADHCAVAIAARFGCGVLLSLGGDLRVAGPEPADGWNVLVKDGHDEPESHIRLSGAEAVATSSTLHRTWRRNGQLMHHVIDPRTRRPAAAYWRTASIAAATCLAANTLSTHALIEGAAAIGMLDRHDVAARLVAADGRVHLIGGWPS